jgi:hypothetical protein
MASDCPLGGFVQPLLDHVDDEIGGATGLEAGDQGLESIG